MVSVIIPASGTGSRFGGDTPKQFLPMKNGLTVLENTLAVFQQIDWINEIIVTLPKRFTKIIMKNREKMTCIQGGLSRSESVYEALKKLSPDTKIVLIHDGVRPMVSVDLIKKVTDAVRIHGAAVAGTVFSDTVKEADADGRIKATPERGRYHQVQTPQGFTYQIISEAYRNTPNLVDFTDDSAVVEHNGGTVYIVQGERRNIKITTQEDLHIANALIEGA